MPINGTLRVWRHTVYLGVYDLESTYESLHRVFGADADAYDERPAGRSACAGVLIDDDGRLIADSGVLSSALWAVARTHDPGPRDPHWMDGFDRAVGAFTEAVDEYEGVRRDASPEAQPPPHDAGSLRDLLKVAQTAAGIDGVEGLATTCILIQSVAVSASRVDESSDIDFLNSFYLDDLSGVCDQVERRNVGPALTAYLTGDAWLRTGDRTDVVASPGTVDAGTAIERLPKGRWPSNPEHALALSQQFAVNEAVNTLGASDGLMGINGPPGTGKTTMLRDILAGNVVERGRRLAALESVEDAFSDVTHRWTTHAGYPRTVRQLRPELVGFEMVVASANNAAVENVTTEIPAQKAIDVRWHKQADYFAAIATQALSDPAGADKAAATDSPVAWGLVSARLGMKRNRAAFRSAFWFDEKDPKTNGPIEGSVPRMQTRLKQWRDGTEPRKTWTQACADFAKAEQKVDVLIQSRLQAQKRLRRLPHLAERERTLSEIIDETRNQLQQVEQDLARQKPFERQVENERTHVETRHERHLGVKPSALETIFTLGRAVREWRAELEILSGALASTEEDHREAVRLSERIWSLQQQGEARLSATKHDLTLIREARTKLRAECARDESRYGDAYPGDKSSGEQRELRAPWLDAELDTARSELFFAALTLHQDFLANAARDLLPGLRAAGEVVAGSYPRRLDAEKLRAAWQLFFLVVPLVSTTFASASRMFGEIGREAVGWLMIDEAGQASPQYAAGAIWRARRVVVVGDPMQLQPVVTIPQKAQRDIAASYGVSATWIPPRASAQTLADRVTTFGTTLIQGEEEVWVSAPLRVHRRCDEPMFTLCNQIAYNGIMVNGVQRDTGDTDEPDRFDGSDGSAPLIAASHWVHEAADTPGSHLQPSQITRLENALAYLNANGIDESEVIAISPFREVADRLASFTANHPKLLAGTIHTAQGQEAPVVILVLGGDPDSPGAKAWAASTPNLVNVAASRAQRRLYVIGDRSAWAQHEYFRELSAALG